MSKYQRAMNQIEVSEELQEKIINSIKQEEFKKVGLAIKIKNAIIAVIALLTTLICGGAVYAALGGKINGIPIIKFWGIEITNDCTNLEEIQNKIIENKYAKLELQSSIFDDSMIILKFNIKIKDINKLRRKGIYKN